jgi:gamma-glutamyltranspeptidase/glutathione hydrolase
VRGIVAAPQPIACEAGRRALERGGNAVDAAVATAMAQMVVDPFNCGLGGFGTMHVFMAETGEDAVLDFHGRVGSRAHPEVFAPDVLGQIEGHAERYAVRGHLNQIGYRAITVPGVVRGLGLAVKRHARLGWAELLGPAVALARDGFAVYGELYRSWMEPTEPGHLDTLERARATDACAAIYTRDGRLYRPGEVLRQPDLARTLEALAAEGPESFYRGPLARRIADDLDRHGAFVTAEDLHDYEVEVRAPVVGPYRGHVVSSSPPPGSGVQVLEILNILEGYDLAALGPASSEYVLLWIQAQRFSFADRTRHLGDPAFVDVPVERLTSKAYAAELRRRIDAGETATVPRVAAAGERAGHTTHVTTLDGAGNAVSLTHTLGTSAGVVTPGLGFMYNNAMYQFHPLPGLPNSIQPGKRRITGLAPSFVFKGGRLRLALGAPGGTRILTAVAMTIVNVIDHAMSAVEAVSAPRIYCDGAVARLESRLFHGVAATLTARGERLQCSEFGYDPFFSPVQAIAVDVDTGRVTGASDPRAGGGCVVVA